VSKYGARRTTVDGVTFDSKAEAARYMELRLMERAGEIAALRVHPRYEILPREGGERARHYTPDFEYREGGKVVVEDVKGGRATMTDAARLRMSLFRRRYPAIELRIVER
jgi:hypothetical protein